MRIKIVTHPANIELLKAKLSQDGSIPEMERVRFFGFDDPYRSLNVVASASMERDKPTGRYVLPDGRVVELEQIEVRTRWVTYEPSDVDYLLWAGIIREEREPVFRVIDQSFIDRWMGHFGDMMVTDRRHFILNTTV